MFFKNSIKLVIRILLLTLLLCTIVSDCLATTLDFENLTFFDTAPCVFLINQGVSSDGFNISKLDQNLFVCNGSQDSRVGFYPSNGTDALLSREFQLTREDDLAFDLNSFEAGEGIWLGSEFNYFDARHISLTGIKLDGTIVNTVISLDLITFLDPTLNDFQLFTFGEDFKQLISITFTGLPTDIIPSDDPTLFFIDNIDLTVVPIPAGIWLIGSALICLVTLCKKV